MMSSLLAQALWLMFASKKGLQVSTTHSINGNIVGRAVCMAVHEQCRIGRIDTSAQAGRYWCFLGIVARVGRRGVLFPVFSASRKTS